MVKGYEFAKDQYVVFSEEELKSMAEEASRTIEITEFVPAAKVDPIYFEGAYYLGPDKGGERAYALLAAAMRQTGRSALAKWAARGKMYIVMVRAMEKGLVMQVLHYADEVRPISEVPIGDTAVKDAELKLAVQLVEQIAAEEFRPENYEDGVRKRYLEAIQRKVEGPGGRDRAHRRAARADHRPDGSAQGQPGPRRPRAQGGAAAAAAEKKARRPTAATAREERPARAVRAGKGRRTA